MMRAKARTTTATARPLARIRTGLGLAGRIG